MNDLVIRPTMKFIRAGYTTVFSMIAVALGLASNIETVPVWIAGALAVLLVWPAQRQLRRRFTKMTLDGSKLRYEVGLFSRVTRTFHLAKIQDVRVEQKLWQRIFGVGDLAIETAGETGALVIRNIDNPQEVADMLGEASQHTSGRVHGL